MSLPHVPRRCRMPIGLMAVFVAACSTVPVTGRLQLDTVPDSTLRNMARSSYQDVLANATVIDSGSQAERLTRVGTRCAKATEDFLRELGVEKKFTWEFNLIKDDETVNAWCMPGGRIAFYTGILPYTQDDTGMAVVMGHEIAHAVANHSGERMSQALVAQMGAIGLNVALQKQPSQTRQLFNGLYAVGAQVGVLLPYSRLHESEADEIGLRIMAMAGYDPREAVDFWGRMSEAGGQRPPVFLSTHPSPDNRIDKIKALLPDIVPIYEKSDKAPLAAANP